MYVFSGDCPPGLVSVAFEICDIGIATPDDPSDDHRMLPGMLDADGDCEYGLQDVDHPASGGDNDPYTDWIYWYDTADESPGEAGYQAGVAALQADPSADPREIEELARTVLVNWNGGDVTTGGPYNQLMPEEGSVIRIVTNKVNSPETIFSIDTDGYQPVVGNLEAAQSAIEMIGIVPNPYMGVSDYEISNLKDVVRFTNMPEEATIRIFTLAGDLIRTILKNSPRTSIEWNLRTDEGLPIASGMYLIHIEVPGVGEKVIKFGAVRKRAQLQFF